MSGSDSVKTAVPAYSFRVNPEKQLLTAFVHVHRIPVTCINYAPTSTRLVIDTLKYSKKLLLDVPFPDGIVCDIKSSEPEAKLEYGILKCILPIKKFGAYKVPEWLAEKIDRKQSIIAQKKRDHPDDSDADSDSDSEPEVAPKSSKAKAVKKSPKSVVASSPAKSALKRKVAAVVAEPEPAASSEPARKKKKLVENLSSSLEMIDEISSVAEKQLKTKLSKMNQKEDFITQQESKKEMRKLKKKELMEKVSKETTAEKKKSATKAKSDSKTLGEVKSTEKSIAAADESPISAPSKKKAAGKKTAAAAESTVEHVDVEVKAPKKKLAKASEKKESAANSEDLSAGESPVSILKKSAKSSPSSSSGVRFGSNVRMRVYKK